MLGSLPLPTHLLDLLLAAQTPATGPSGSYHNLILSGPPGDAELVSKVDLLDSAPFCPVLHLPIAAPSVLDSALQGNIPIPPVSPWMSLAVTVYPRSLSHHCPAAFLFSHLCDVPPATAECLPLPCSAHPASGGQGGLQDQLSVISMGTFPLSSPLALGWPPMANGGNITFFNSPKRWKDANFSIPCPQALLCFPEGA